MSSTTQRKGASTATAVPGIGDHRKVTTAIVYKAMIAGVLNTVAIQGDTGAIIGNQAAALNTDNLIFNIAITYVSALGGGEMVILAEGFVYAATINLVSNVNIRGLGNATVLTAGAGVTANCFTLSSADEVAIRDLQIDGNDTSDVGIFTETSDHTLIDNVHIHNCDEAGIDFDGNGGDYPRLGSMVKNCLIHDINKAGDGHGIKIGKTSEITYCSVIENRIYDCSRAINVFKTGTGSNNNTLRGNIISFCTSTAVTLESSRASLIDNKINHNEAIGCLITDPSCTVIGNYFVANGAEGLFINNGDYTAIIANILYNNTTSELRIHNTASVKVLGNEFDNGDVEDIHLSGTTSGTIIENNISLVTIINPELALLHERFFEVMDPDGTIGDYPALVLTDDADITLNAMFVVPNKMIVVAYVEAIIIPGGTGNLRRSVASDFGSIGSEAYNAHSDSIAVGQVAVTADRLEAIDITSAFDVAALAGGDAVGLAFTREAIDALDTVDADCYYLGIRIRYV